MNNRLRCLTCGAFVVPDGESNAEREHYVCFNCMSTGYVPVTIKREQGEDSNGKK